ncbi:unnamed protein product [Fusarium venenatum]|uniref:Uncharacterized protein n=1 Tax=Fusarium venenatum TaxID=56646 RepID=A0A2L2SRB6_9HYPO|nr:uncharacterized protein FVRRES_12341 [Fusarium venenatum]CEI39650.1 unnamed protein product [Fusarium venenatum]
MGLGSLLLDLLNERRQCAADCLLVQEVVRHQPVQRGASEWVLPVRSRQARLLTTHEA